ncbi:MAG: hypothetical protein Q4B87_01265 [Candidatus Saccharibacteria bacterium]|nr:hypothetical protein [Candidatus Saccharibacteria bacterium]
MGLTLFPSTFNPEIALATSPLPVASVSATSEESFSSNNSAFQTPVSTFAAEGDTTGGKAVVLVKCWEEGKDSKNGAGISCVIRLVINILSVLVGIVGIIGIVVVGIQYLTAGGSEEQTRKAKRRLFEIVIGIVAYVLLAAFLNWLLPNFDTSASTSDPTSYLRPTAAIYLGA